MAPYLIPQRMSKLNSLRETELMLHPHLSRLLMDMRSECSPYSCHFSIAISPYLCKNLTPQPLIFSLPYQMHNEEIVNHLYNAGFQTGVHGCLLALISPLTYEQNYADTILVNNILASGCPRSLICLQMNSMCTKIRIGFMPSYFRDLRSLHI